MGMSSLSNPEYGVFKQQYLDDPSVDYTGQRAAMLFPDDTELEGEIQSIAGNLVNLLIDGEEIVRTAQLSRVRLL